MANNYELTIGLGGDGSIGFLRGSYGNITTVPGRPLLDVPVDEFRVRSLFDPVNPLGLTLRLQGGVKSRNRDLISAQVGFWTIEAIWNESLGSYETGADTAISSDLQSAVGLTVPLTIIVAAEVPDLTQPRVLRNTWFAKANHIEPFKQQVCKTLIDENLGVFTPPVPSIFPDAFDVGDWSVATGSGANEIDMTINQLPADNGVPITQVQFEVNNLGLWVPLTILTGTETIPMPAAGVPYDFQVRAINALGNPGPDSDTKAATSGAGGGGGTTGLLSGAEEASYDGAYLQATIKGTVDGPGATFNTTDTTFAVWSREILGVYYVLVWNGIIWIVGTTTTDPETWTNGGATGIEQISPTPEPIAMASEDIDGSSSPDSSNMLPGYTMIYIT
ncbi:MAG: hypothetical protein GKR86_00065 [Ilumatobacter sp.]|nr:hypothetical protein [Ilumatobacter sp.]